MSSEKINFKEMGKYLNKLFWDKEDLEHAKKFINQISYLSDEKFMKKDFEGLEEFEYFIANNNKVLIPTLGQYSTGKSSVLNILIGEKYLPSSEGVCTNVGVIIEYTSNKNIAELYEIKFKQNNKYFTFEKTKIICNDKTKIKDTIEKKNKDHRLLKLEDSFLLLKVNVELFELIEEEYRDKILLIDFPGLNVLENKNFFSSDVLSPLINQSDSFLFFNSEVINTNENQEIIMNLVEKIKIRKISFSYKNCLFIMNKWDKHIKNNNNYSLNQAKKDLKEIFENNRLDDIFEDIDIINCSAEYYENFIEEKKEILNFEEYIQNLKNLFDEEYDLDEHNEDEDKNEQFYSYIIEDINTKKKKIKNLLTIKENLKTKECEKIENILKDDYKLEDNNKIENIINEYLSLVKSIDNHELLINSNKIILEQKIIKLILSSIMNLKKNIENKGINFLKNINNTINFVLKRLDNPKKFEMKYSKIEQSKKRQEEIKNIFNQFKGIIQFEFENYLNKEEKNINNYINKINELFEEKNKENNNSSNKEILGQIEKEKIAELKMNKKQFYAEMAEHFEKFTNEINRYIKIIKKEINIDEKSFEQEYFETTDKINNKSWFWEAIYKLTKLLAPLTWSESILHRKILYDDRETIIQNSIKNFNLVKSQNIEALKDYKKVFIVQLNEFEINVKDEVQKMIDLSYSDYTKFKKDSKQIIYSSTNEFNKYIKSKYKKLII